MFSALVQLDLDTWVRDHSPLLVWIGLLLFSLLLVRLIVQRMTKALALTIVAFLALIVYTERQSIRECSRTCECEIGPSDVDVPFCRPGLGF